MKTAERMTGPQSAWLRVVVSPGPGRVRLLPPRRFREGREWVDRGQPLARLEQGGRHVLIRAPMTGRVSSVMALEGEPVVSGQAVMAIEQPHGRGGPT